ncbi:MAG: folate-binding protein [Pseudomonadota bacterium]
MTDTLLLSERAVLSVTGEEAESFLDGLLTNSVTNMQSGDQRYAALLTPQGKIIADMIMSLIEDGFLIDCPSQADQTLLKRLKLFKLKAKVDIDERTDLAVYAFHDDGLPDPRSADLATRHIGVRKEDEGFADSAYHSARIAAGIPEFGVDFGAEDAFPADVNMDMIGGVDFKKGCFVGQEVVSRMKRRGTARRRTLRLDFEESAPTRGAAIMAGDAQIGEITSRESKSALARIRIDRMAKAEAKGDAINVDGEPAIIVKPDWLAGELEAVVK